RFGFCDQIGHDSGGRGDLVDQTRSLAPVKDRLLNVAPLASLEHVCQKLLPMPSDVVRTAQPALDQPVARDARVGAWPLASHQDVADVGDDRVRAVAVEDRLLERIGKRGLRTASATVGTMCMTLRPRS